MLIDAIRSSVTPLTAVVYLIVSFIGWYAINGFSYGLNSGQLGRGKWWIFECFWEDLLRNIPGGSKRKTDAIRAMVGPDSDCGRCVVGPSGRSRSPG